MFTKHTFHSTVNPLDAKQTHKEPFLPGHCGTKGRLCHRHRPASLGFLFGFFFVHATPLPPSTAAVCIWQELAFSGGICFLPPPRLFPLGCWERWEELCGKAPVSARGDFGSVGDAGTPSLPSHVHFKAKLLIFFSPRGQRRAGKGCSRSPRGMQDLPYGCAGSGPSVFPAWENPIEILLETLTSP